MLCPCYLNLDDLFQINLNTQNSHGVVVWQTDDARGAAEEEPESSQQSHEGVGQREGQDGATGEEDHC